MRAAVRARDRSLNGPTELPDTDATQPRRGWPPPWRVRRPVNDRRTRVLAIAAAVAAGAAAVWLAVRGIREPSPPQPMPLAVRPTQTTALVAQREPDLDRVAHNGLFAALGRATYRGRRWLPIVGLLIVAGLYAWSAVAGDRLSQGGWQVPGSEAARAEALFSDRFGESATTLIILFTDPDGDAASPEFQATVADALAPLEDEPIVD